MRLDDIRIHYPDAKETRDGAIHFECPTCRNDGHPGKDFTLFANGATSCIRASAAGREFNREHCVSVRQQLRLTGEPASAFITSTLFEGERQVALELDRVNKSVQFLTARNCKDVLHSAELRMSKPDERAAFVASIPDRDDDERAAIAREMVQMFDRFRKSQVAVDQEAPNDDKESAATRLVQLAEEAHLIHNADGDGFAVMVVDGHKETWLLRSKGFKRWLQRKFFEQYKKAPGSQAVHDALGVIEGKALYDGPERRIFVRIGEKDGKIYLDLADDKWRAIEIDADGWRVVNIPPIEFKRAKGMLPLPEPERGGSVEELRPFMNLENGDLWTLLLGSLVMKYRPCGPYNVDVLTGGQGCGKTTRARVVRALVDPNSADTRSAPREIRDLQIAASNEWLPILDNMSRMPEWLSDGLCCMSTGSAMRTRELYSDADEAIFAAMRPVMLTSITEVVERPDLLDRSIIYNLPQIEKRKSEKELWALFEKARPRILGALLDAVSCALRNEDSVVIKDPSRMADFERWATAAEPALGFKHGTFLRAYRKNQNSANDLALEACPITEYITELAEKHVTWLGKAKELFDLLFEGVDEEQKRKRKEHGWPKTPTVLSAVLRRIAPNLKMHGIELTFNINEGNRRRLIKIEFKSGQKSDDQTEPPDNSEKSSSENNEENIQDYAGKSAYACVSACADDENTEVTDDDAYALSNDADARRTHFDDETHAQRTHSEECGQSSKDSKINDLSELTYARTQTYALLHTQSDAIDDLDTEPVHATIVALDCETEEFDDKRGITPRNARMLGLSLSHDGKGQTSCTEDRETWALLIPEPEQTVVMHHAKFDLLKLKQAGLPTPQKWECTQIASHLLNEIGNHGLKPLVKEHFGVDLPTYKEVQKERLFDPDAFNEYAKNDSRFTYRLWQKFEPELDQQGLRPVYELEKAVTPVVMAMEEAGIKLDLEQMGEMRQTVQAEADNIEAEVYEHAGCRFDLHSPQKVAAILFDKLGVPSVKETNGGQRSVDREALEDVRGYHPAVDAILRYREIDKLASTFLGVLPTFADEQGRIHPEFKQLGATSGRFSCSNPNVQQIPSRSELGKKLRRMFVADEGNVLVVADWSQMELRILAQYSKDLLLLSAYQSGAETDLHTLTAARMFGKVEADVTKSERAVAKMINFGIAYGITSVGLFNRLRPQGVDVTEEQCEQFILDYFKAYSGVRKFLDQVKPILRERGYVRNWFGRRRRVSGETPRQIRQAQNFIIQSTAADMAKTAMVRLHGLLPDGARLIAMVHDEFIVECRRDLAEDVQALMVEAMQTAPNGFIVPMVVEAKIADNWGDAK